VLFTLCNLRIDINYNLVVVMLSNLLKGFLINGARWVSAVKQPNFVGQKLYQFFVLFSDCWSPGVNVIKLFSSSLKLRANKLECVSQA
jgi:hypothetical protein